ncbi:MAG: Acetate kinase, partial [Candidatus Anoxychlamydiales bacterium]|nr:Acetate kinase [Candidatus Anoxychlamydiales bacterium]
MDSLIVLNTGSSSMKFSIFSIHGNEMKREYSGSVTGLSDKPHIKIIKESSAKEIDEDLKVAGDSNTYVKQTLHFILDWTKQK